MTERAPPPPLKGPTKFFFSDPAIDHLFSMVLSLGAEIAALREELSVLRGVLDEKGLLGAEDFAAYAPSAASETENERFRQEMVSGLLLSLQHAAAATGAGRS